MNWLLSTTSTPSERMSVSISFFDNAMEPELARPTGFLRIACQHVGPYGEVKADAVICDIPRAFGRHDQDRVNRDAARDLFVEHDLFRKPASTFRDHALISTVAQRALDRVTPPRPFALPRRGVHLRPEAPRALPWGREARQVRTQSRRAAGEISSADGRRLHHSRTIDRRGKDVGDELHGDVARGHAAVDPQDRVCSGPRP